MDLGLEKEVRLGLSLEWNGVMVRVRNKDWIAEWGWGEEGQEVLDV